MTAMAEHTSPPPGGFLPSPPTTTATPASSVADSVLPRPRSNTLKPGSHRETEFISYVDAGIKNVTRRYAKKFMGAVEGEGASRGYEKFKEVAQDIGKLVDVIWVSGTPSLQKQYLLVLAQLVSDYLPSFPSTPQYAFPLLNKLDYALASLLLGEDFETRTALPGFGAGKVISGTDKVRMKSIVERARIVVVDVMENGEKDTESEDEGDDDEEDEEEDYNVEEETPNWDMAIAKVYDRTIVELGQGVEENGLGVSKC